MELIDLYIRYSEDNVILDKAATFLKEDNLVFREEENRFKARAIVGIKFSLINVASPLISTVRVIRSVVFLFTGDLNRAGREFIGGLATPLVAGSCLVGSLLSSVVYVINPKSMRLHIQTKRAYAYFEAWINGIDLRSKNLASYSCRVSNPLDFIGNSTPVHKHVWTTAPCLQPVLEKGFSACGGIFDKERMKKILPLVEIFDIQGENDKIVIQSKYQDKKIYIKLFNGACEHARYSATCCCCFRIEAAYDRILCCEMGQGNCTSIADHSDTCGFVFCTAGCVGICCCTEKNNVVQVNTCLV